MLRAIQKMQNSLTLRQQHFLYQRKKLYDQESSRSSSGEIVPENLHENLQPEFFISALYRTLSEIAALPRVKLGIPAGAPGGHHCNIKWKMNDRNMQEGSSWLLNISDTETSARVLRNTWVHTGCVMEKKHIV